MRVKSSGLAQGLANARPPGSATFANAPPPGLTRRASAPQLPGGVGGGGAGRRWNWLMHKRAQRSCKTCKHKNYCRSIRRKENSEIIHSRKLIGSFKAISIFPTLMEKVILLGLSGTTKWSSTWSSGGNTFFFCLNKDFGRTLTWTRVKCGLLPGRTARSWRTFVAPLHPVHVNSLFCHFYLLLEHLISLLGRRRALLVDGKSQHRWQLCGYILCSLERTPSNKLNFPYPDIIYQNLHYTLCKNYLHCIHYLQTSIFSPELSKHCSRNSPSLNLTALRAV